MSRQAGTRSAAPGDHARARFGRAAGPAGPAGAARIVIIAAAAALHAGCGSGGVSADERTAARPTLVVMRDIVAAMGRSILDSVSARLQDTVMLDVDSSSLSWMVRTEVGSLLGSSGRTVLSGRDATPAGSRWSVRGLVLSSEYREIRKSGVFSEPVVDRVVTATFSTEITSGGSVVYSGPSTGNVVDTVEERLVQGLESETAGYTRSPVPDLRSFDRYIEPFVIIGAAGVAILLFFQVRS